MKPAAPLSGAKHERFGLSNQVPGVGSSHGPGHPVRSEQAFRGTARTVSVVYVSTTAENPKNFSLSDFVARVIAVSRRRSKHCFEADACDSAHVYRAPPTWPREKM